jgi:hypothetical protein
MMRGCLFVIVLHGRVLVSGLGFCRGATSSTSFDLRAALNARTLPLTRFCQCSSRKELCCFRAGGGSDTLSERRGRNKQAFHVQY